MSEPEKLSVHREALYWPDPESGPWKITAHWAKVDGRLTMVGLDIRSFVETLAVNKKAREPIPVRQYWDGPGTTLSEITQAVLRGIPIGTVRETTRARTLERATPEGARRAGWGDLAEFVARKFAERMAEPTVRGGTRRRVPAPDRETLEAVAKLYNELVADGLGAPAKRLEERLRAAGNPVLASRPVGNARAQAASRALVRKWIEAARDAGLITTGGRKQR